MLYVYAQVCVPCVVDRETSFTSGAPASRGSLAKSERSHRNGLRKRSSCQLRVASTAKVRLAGFSLRKARFEFFFGSFSLTCSLAHSLSHSRSRSFVYRLRRTHLKLCSPIPLCARLRQSSGHVRLNHSVRFYFFFVSRRRLNYPFLAMGFSPGVGDCRIDRGDKQRATRCPSDGAPYRKHIDREPELGSRAARKDSTRLALSLLLFFSSFDSSSASSSSSPSPSAPRRASHGLRTGKQHSPPPIATRGPNSVQPTALLH